MKFFRSKLTSLITALALMLSLSSGALALSFDDVAGDIWYSEAVDYVTDAGIFLGTGGGKFSPDAEMTRGMYVTALGRLMFVEESELEESSFEDVDPEAFYASYVEWAAAEGIVNGTGEGIFSPDQSITREEMATILYRCITSYELILAEEAEAAEFADAGSISDWAKDAVTALQVAGIINGIPSDEGILYRPQSTSSRSEVAAVLMRFDINAFGSRVADDEANLATAESFVRHMFASEIEQAEALVHPGALESFEAIGGLEALAQQMQAMFGKLVSIDGSSFLTSVGGLSSYLIEVTTENGAATINISVTEGQVAGIAVLPGAEPVIAMPEGFVETKITVDAGEGFPLEGRLVMPESSETATPLVILIQGSGATDHDEIMGVNRIFGKIAAGLAKQGIATLRYDKRNFAYPEIAMKKDYSIEDEYIADVLAAIELAKATEGVDKDNIFILGHSQGGMLAPLFMSRSEGVKGMILFAGTPRSLMDVMVDQQGDIVAYYEANGMADYAAEYKGYMAEWAKEREALAGMTAEQALEAGTVYGMGAYYMYVLEQNKAIETIKELAVPTLIMQGGADMQVYADKDYKIYLDELGGEDYASFKLYDGLSHSFTPSVSDNIIDAMNEYYVRADIPATVFEDIAAWVGANK